MGCNDPAHKEEFLAWLKERIEKCGFTVDDAPDYMKDAYVSGKPKDLNRLVWTEWFDYMNTDWRARAYAKGGMRDRHGPKWREPSKLKRGFNSPPQRP